MAQARAYNSPQSGDPQMTALKLPPHSIEAEQSLLGGLMLDNSAWDRIADQVAEVDFYRDDHRRIFRHSASQNASATGRARESGARSATKSPPAPSIPPAGKPRRCSTRPSRRSSRSR